MELQLQYMLSDSQTVVSGLRHQASLLRAKLSAREENIAELNESIKRLETQMAALSRSESPSLAPVSRCTTPSRHCNGGAVCVCHHSRWILRGGPSPIILVRDPSTDGTLGRVSSFAVAVGLSVGALCMQAPLRDNVTTLLASLLTLPT